MAKVAATDWAWLAGLFEGEGCISLRGTRVQLDINMTDRDVLERVNRLVPAPSGIKSVPKSAPHHKDKWRWGRSDRDDVIEFLEGVYPWLLTRRRAKADEAFTVLARNPGAMSKRTHCKRGHPLRGDNLRVNRAGARVCRQCSRERQRSG